MTTMLKKNLRVLSQSIKENTPVVESKYTASGVTPDPAVVFSTAKYLTAITKLANEK